MKLFKILGTTYRCELDWLDDVVQVCAQLVNIDFETRPLRKSSIEERVLKCESCRIVADQKEYEANAALNEKRAAKMKKQQLLLNDRVSVWFDDKGKCYRGIIRRVDENDWFEIEWTDQKEPNETVRLEQCNRTKSKANPDRWWKIGDK
jgi:hypothetical protein